MALALVAACASPKDSFTSPSATIGSTPSFPPTVVPVAVVRLPSAEPAERVEAALEAAFDPATAAALAAALPTDLDWGSTGVVCLYLGRRDQGGWGLAIQSASLVDGELRVLARETRPGTGVQRPGPEYPADCATIDRAPLPVGRLPARADDTVSDEFIVAGELEVPAP